MTAAAEPAGAGTAEPDEPVAGGDAGASDVAGEVVQPGTVLDGPAPDGSASEGPDSRRAGTALDGSEPDGSEPDGSTPDGPDPRRAGTVLDDSEPDLSPSDDQLSDDQLSDDLTSDADGARSDAADDTAADDTAADDDADVTDDIGSAPAVAEGDARPRRPFLRRGLLALAVAGFVALGVGAFAWVAPSPAAADQQFVDAVRSQGHDLVVGEQQSLVVSAARKICDRRAIHDTDQERRATALTIDEISAVGAAFGADTRDFTTLALKTYCSS